MLSLVALCLSFVLAQIALAQDRSPSEVELLAEFVSSQAIDVICDRCKPDSIKSVAAASALVVTGVVNRLDSASRPIERMEHLTHEVQVVTVEISEVLKGSASGQILVHSPTPDVCGVDFALEQPYLIYAHRKSDSTLWAYGCNRTQRLSDVADKELRKLRRRRERSRSRGEPSN